MKPKKSVKKKSSEEVVPELFTEFCESTSLHGWGFYGRSKKSEGKFSPSAIFWLIVIIFSVSSAVYVMTNNIQGERLSQTHRNPIQIHWSHCVSTEIGNIQSVWK